jgi:hypothetical protein
MKLELFPSSGLTINISPAAQHEIIIKKLGIFFLLQNIALENKRVALE